MSLYTGPGTISISGQAVTGSGTTFLTSGVKPGCILFAGVGESMAVLSVNSDTSLTLAKAWAGASVSGSSAYAILSIDAVAALLRLNDLLDTIDANSAAWLLNTGMASAAEVDVASAAACNIGGAASYEVRVTGTTTITSFSNMASKWRFVRFAAALTLTHGSALNLPGAANITTAAGDRAVVWADAAGNCFLVFLAAAGIGTSQIMNAAVTLAKHANINQYQILMRTSSGAGPPEALSSSALVAAMLAESSGAGVLTALGLRFALGSIADDGVATFNPSGNSVSGIIFPNLPGTQPTASFTARRTATVTISGAKLHGGSNLVDFNATGGTLNGTTGTDGRLTMRVDTNGVIYVENRLGASVSFTVILFPI